MRHETVTDIKERRWPIIGAILIGVVCVHSFKLSLFPVDAEEFLLPWRDHIKAAGLVGAFAAPFGNYTPPLLYLFAASTLLDGVLRPLYAIKLLSLIGAGWLALAIRRLLIVFQAPRPGEAALWSFMLPSVVLNTTALGQTDTFWVAPCIMAVAAAARGKLLALVVWSGLAFAIKAQAAFLAPFVIAVLVSHRGRWWLWLVPTLVYAGVMFPAWLAGWPAWDLATVYLRQAAWQPSDGGLFISNAASWWSIFGLVAPQLAVKSFWLGYLLATAGTAGFIVITARVGASRRQMLAGAVVSTAMLPWLLPLMHERYLMLADVLAFCYAMTVRSRRAVTVAVLVQISSAGAVYGYMINSLVPAAVGAVLLPIAIWPVVSALRRHPQTENCAT